jgi:hypothetical protein
MKSLRLTILAGSVIPDGERSEPIRDPCTPTAEKK